MKFQLRGYQEESVAKAVPHIKDPKAPPGLLVLPTGAGKSLVIANIVRELEEPTIIFQPSKEILRQNFHKYLSYGEEASVYSASAGRKEIGHVTFGTIGSVYRKADIFKHFKYVIIDECHGFNASKGMYKEFVETVGSQHLLGLTATPYRLGAGRGGYPELRFLTRSRPAVFKKVVHCVQIQELYDAGYLCPLEYHQLKNFDRSKVRLNQGGTDFDEQSLKTYYGSIDFEGGVVKVVRRLLSIGRKGVLVFTRFVEEARRVAEQIPGAAYVSADTPKKERDIIIAQFKAGKIPAICNVGVLLLGFDYPELDTIVMARPTMSLALYYQALGRGMRPHFSKEKTMIVDMCGNINFFGAIEDLELCGADTRTPYIRNKVGVLTNVPIMRQL